MVCASSLAMGLLTNAGEQPWHPAGNEIKALCRKAAEYCKSQNVELAQLALYHCLQLNDVSTHLVGMQSGPLLAANLHTLQNGLNEKELQALDYVKKK